MSEASPIAPCPTGGVWILMQMWEHYLYTEDTVYLKNQAFPLIESAAVFFNQYIFMEEETGYYTSGPSISPENSFLYNNKPYQISNGCTYEILMIRELFQVYLTASNILNMEASEFQSDISYKLEHLLPYRITEEGTISEWSHNLEQADRQHRHTSHLLGLYPFSQITPQETPELCEAAEKTLQVKLNPIDHWEDTGWARSMLMLYEARLGNGNMAYKHIKSMQEKLLEPNQMVYHPPTRGAGAFDHVYELDGNTGLTSCITEMLLQSHKNRIQLLPALPAEWRNGEIRGVRARGNIEVDIIWKNGELFRVSLKAKRNKSCKVVYADQTWDITLTKDLPYVIKR